MRLRLLTTVGWLAVPFLGLRLTSQAFWRLFATTASWVGVKRDPTRGKLSKCSIWILEFDIYSWWVTHPIEQTYYSEIGSSLQCLGWKLKTQWSDITKIERYTNPGCRISGYLQFLFGNHHFEVRVIAGSSMFFKGSPLFCVASLLDASSSSLKLLESKAQYPNPVTWVLMCIPNMVSKLSKIISHSQTILGWITPIQNDKPYISLGFYTNLYQWSFLVSTTIWVFPKIGVPQKWMV